MTFTAIVAALVALGWALLSSWTSASSELLARDPTTLELAIMALVTLSAYSWAHRARVPRHQSIAGSIPAPLERAEVAEPAQSTAQDAAEHAA